MDMFKKNSDGVLNRVEYRGKNIRISRTGGVALRTHIKVKGVNVSLNSAHGVRLSTKLSKGTQVGLQNGRFYIKGRYGSGPTKLNLSKSGVTVSTSNKHGSINWIKPGRSSFKFAGLNVRGKKAYDYQVLYIIYAAFVLLIKSVIKASFFYVKTIFALFMYSMKLLSKMTFKIMRLFGLGSILKGSWSFSSAISEGYDIDDTSDATILLWAFHLRLSGLDYEAASAIGFPEILDVDKLLMDNSLLKMLKVVFDKGIDLIQVDHEQLCRLYCENFGKDALLGVLLDMDEFFCRYNVRTQLQEDAIIKSLKSVGVEIEFPVV